MLGANSFFMKIKFKTKKSKIVFWILGFLYFFSAALSAFGQEPPKGSEQEKEKTEFQAMKAEWEQVREQQIQMIQEKEEQLEKLKEELFAKKKVISGSSVEQKTDGQPRELQGVGVPLMGKQNSEEKASALLRKEADLNKRERDLRELETKLEQKKKDLDAREAALTEKSEKAKGDSHVQDGHNRFEKEENKTGFSPMT